MAGCGQLTAGRGGSWTAVRGGGAVPESSPPSRTDPLIGGLAFAFPRRPLCGSEGAAAPTLTRAGGWAMAEISDLDRQIEQLRRCELIKESEVKALCAKAR